MTFVASVFGVVLLLAGMSSSAPAKVASKPADACRLLTTAQASSLLGGTVTAQNVGTSIPICTYWLSSPSAPGGKVAGMTLVLRRGAKARTTYEDLLHRRVPLPHGFPLSAADLAPHPITVDDVHGFFMVESPSAHTPAPAMTSSFVALKDGYLVDIGVKPLPTYVSVAREALGDVLARLP